MQYKKECLKYSNAIMKVFNEIFEVKSKFSNFQKNVFIKFEEETKKHIKFEEKKEKKEYFYKGIEDYLKDISSTDYDNMINKYEPFKFEIEEKKKKI